MTSASEEAQVASVKTVGPHIVLGIRACLAVRGLNCVYGSDSGFEDPKDCNLRT